MSSSTPMALKRRTISRIAALNPRVRAMEQRAHSRCLLNYSSEIFDHLSNLEETTKSSPDLIQSQPEISIAMRPILFDFLTDVHNRLKLSNSTFFLTINIIDRYCSLRIVRKDHFQLLGLTALWLASKFSETKHKVPTLDFLRATCCNCYSKNLFIEMETHILKSLNWEVGSAGHDSFIDLMLREKLNSTEMINGDTVNNIKYGANYLCQLMQFYSTITFHYSVSQIAIASVIIMTSSLTLSNEGNFIHFKNATNNNGKLTNLMETMLNILRNDQPPNSFKLKYFNKKDDLKANPTLFSIYLYSKELNYRSQKLSINTPTSSPLSSTSSSKKYYPETPTSMCSTPVSSRASSTSSESSKTYNSTSSTSPPSINTSKFYKSIMMTPPGSCASSPIDLKSKSKPNHHRSSSRIFRIPSTMEHSRTVPLQELKIQAPQSFKTGVQMMKCESEYDVGVTIATSGAVESDMQSIRKRSLEI